MYKFFYALYTRACYKLVVVSGSDNREHSTLKKITKNDNFFWIIGKFISEEGNKNGYVR